MASGTYGTTIGAKINANDVEIYYSYRPSLNSDSSDTSTFTKISSNILVQSLREQDAESVDNILEGMYNLKLPLQYFNKKGFYTVFIKPKEISASIVTIGALSDYPTVKGIVINTENIQDNTLKTKFQSNNELVGYRIVYLDDSGERQDYHRIVTSNNKVEPITTTDGTAKFRYNESSTLTFITVTPSTSTEFKPNAIPYIGKSTQKVLFVNTKFSPISIDIEMIDHNADTITNMLEGSQLRDLDNGLVTTFNDNGEVYSQSEYYSLKNEYNGIPIFEVRKNKGTSIDFSQTITDK